MTDNIFKQLQVISKKPAPFSFYTTPLMWNDEYVSQKMLEAHLMEGTDLASRNMAFIERSVDWITKKFDVGEGTRICDFGCGPGLYTTRFAQRGAEVTGIDLSERSIDYAKKTAKEKNLSIDYLLQNYLDYNGNTPFDLITMIFCDFSVLSPQQRKKLLGIFHKNLKDDGALLLDVFSPNHFNGVEECSDFSFSPGNPGDLAQGADMGEYTYKPGDGFWSPEPYYVFRNTFKYTDEKVVLDKYVIIEENRCREIYNWLQFYDRESLENLFRECGFTITGFYANVAGDDWNGGTLETAVVAKKLS